jgi:sugar/nucleoside kinase (ribokinase family)
VSKSIDSLLARHHIHHRPLRVLDHKADWTLLLTSGSFGDKLPIGFRGCHDALTALPKPDKCDLLVFAGLANRLLSKLLSERTADVCLLAPAMRNVVDRQTPLASCLQNVDIISCNRGEWERLANRAEILERTPIVAVTDGAKGGLIYFHDLDRTANTLSFPAFPRTHPPRDTNRAGEAFGSTFVKTLIAGGWMPGPCSRELIRQAALHASVAAALVIDRLSFGFPSDDTIESALKRGTVESHDDGASGVASR